jgi:general secretion pathway protein M
MIPPWQTPALRRLLFLLGNLTAGFAIMLTCVIPVRDFLADRDREIQQQRTTFARLQAVAAREAGTPALAKGEFLTGKADGIINADLQTRLKGMVEVTGARLRSVRNLQPKADAQVRYIGSHVEVLGSMAAIHRAIHAIESAKPYLFVTSATIRLAPPMGQAGAPQEPLLEVQLDVFGAVRTEAREP